MHWSFAKYVGCGNDFVIFDNRKDLFPHHNSTLIQALCHRQWGIGADGLILLECSKQADFRMRIFNADGHEAEMCGNGIRCLMKFLQSLGITHTTYRIETMKKTLTLSHQGTQVCVEMGNPSEIRWNIPLPFKQDLHAAHFLETGVPHVVIFVSNLELDEWKELGPFIRHHPLFAPKGTNVNLARYISPNRIEIRTYERGVESETLACGTGATAAALATAYLYQLNGPIQVRTRSGEAIEINYQLKDQNFSSVTMTGPAYCTYKGEIDLSNRSGFSK